MIITILFWITFLLILHTYVIYPLLLITLDKIIKKKNTIRQSDYTPAISVIMAVHNEEQVIRKKTDILFSTDYPASEIEIIIGSDASDDGTNKILEELKLIYPLLKVVFFENRTGKPAIINQLSSQARGEILIITDANVFPGKDSIRKLISNFADKSVGLTDSRLINTGLKKEGISLPEVTYLNIEAKLKNIEGRLWGKMMGPFGGFYAVRKSSYEPNSDKLLTDDFRICMNVIRKGDKAISDTEAIVYEDVSNNLTDEFNRKIRISAGNFQNLNHFAFLLLNPFRQWSFCFISHKMLRWIAPFLWLIMIPANILLINSSFFYLLLLLLQVIFILLPAFDMILKKFNIHLVPLRFFTHLYFMNLALLIGFVKYLRGIRSGAWAPTKRYQ